MVVVGRRTADLDEFMEKLEATGAFENVLPHQQNLNDEGLTQATIDGMLCRRSRSRQRRQPGTRPASKDAGAGGARKTLARRRRQERRRRRRRSRPRRSAR
jgi:hypothetical protein